MEPNQALDSSEQVSNIDIVEISVVLVATSNNPSILNADFLRYNNIVDRNRKVHDPQVSTPAYSQVTLEGGLTVKADPERVIFEQKADKLAIDDIVCLQTANRYVRNVPHVPYRAIGINPKAFVLAKGSSADMVSNTLIGNGAWMSFKDITPKVQLKAIYGYNDRTITFDVAEVEKKEEDGRNSPGVLYQGNFHRDITETKQEERIRKLSTIVQSGLDDLFEFRLLVKNFRERN